jgi:exopolysaccharide biosynthesis protein
MASRRRFLASVAAVLVATACRAPSAGRTLGTPTVVAPGVELYRTADDSLVNHAGPIAVSLLKIDPSLVTLRSALSNREVMHADTVEGIARSVNAIAAVNGGYFNRDNGEPIGLLKVGGELVSDTGSPRGAVVISEQADGRTMLAFDRLAAKMTLTYTVKRQSHLVGIDGVDTTRARGKLMLYTPQYHADTDTAPTGTEWVLDGVPLRVVDVRMNFGHTRIPPRGAVLSFGGTDLPPELAALVEDVPVTFATRWTSVYNTSPAVLDNALDIVAGAGLLRQSGAVIEDWGGESLSPDEFTHARHPRTLIGVDKSGFIWLIAVDGRQPSYSIGMTFEDLQRLCDRLGLTDALNLDGGGSTTMVVKGQLMNRVSDSVGPRAVSDALVVLPRP